MCRRRQLQSKSTWVSSTLYLTRRSHSLSDAALLQNTCLAFLGRNTPTPLISDIFAEVDATILEALCRKGTTDAHGEWTAVYRRFVDMKLQLPHFWEGFGVTPNAGSAISAFYAASVSLVQWLGFCSHSEQNFIDLASTWAPGQDLANPDQWPALFCLLSSKLTKSF